MENLTYDQRQEILDFFGSMLIENVRDRSLNNPMKIVKGTTVNPIKLKQYKALLSLSIEQQEAVCDLISETITNTIYYFLDMFEANDDKIKLIVRKDGIEYDLNSVSEKMGGEIAFDDEDGWIQKFSKIGRFVL
jgi:hypothetical protein